MKQTYQVNMGHYDLTQNESLCSFKYAMMMPRDLFLKHLPELRFFYLGLFEDVHLVR